MDQEKFNIQNQTRTFYQYNIFKKLYKIMLKGQSKPK